MAASPARPLVVGVPALQRMVSIIRSRASWRPGPNEFLTNGTVRMRAHARAHPDPGARGGAGIEGRPSRRSSPTGGTEVCSLDCAVASHALPP
jgi:hypothetical protein